MRTEERSAPPRRYGDDRVPAGGQGTNGFAVASLVLGIVWIWGIGSILALVFGYVGKSQIDRSGGAQSGRGLAVAGIVLGWIGVALLTLAVILFLLGALTMPWGPMMERGGR